jgi:hypothetical protein
MLITFRSHTPEENYPKKSPLCSLPDLWNNLDAVKHLHCKTLSILPSKNTNKSNIRMNKSQLTSLIRMTSLTTSLHHTFCHQFCFCGCDPPPPPSRPPSLWVPLSPPSPEYLTKTNTLFQPTVHTSELARIHGH